MSYYLLPTKNSTIDIFTEMSDKMPLEPYISPSLEYYLKLTSEQLTTITEENPRGYTIFFLQKIINPHEYIFTKVHGSKISVSKMKPHSADFYIFLEIIQTLNLFDSFAQRKLKTIILGPNFKAIIECIDFVRENYEDNNTIEYSNHNTDFMYFELDNTDIEKYVSSMLSCLKNILAFQGKAGISVIKLNSIIHKPILDIIFLLTSLYEKIYIIKPNASNICSSDRFIVAKNFILSTETINYYSSEINSILINKKDKFVSSIVKQDLPYYFLNKVEEANIIIGHQQLETIEQMVNLIKNKNKEDKIETLKKNNIQKCIQWCEKYKIPYNKFVEKVNMFLNTFVEDLSQEQQETTEEYSIC